MSLELLHPRTRNNIVVSDGGCWLWQGFLNPQGYAQSNALIHRRMYERLVGEIPTGLFIDHLCRVRHCVNPEHLEPVTHDENMRRASEARTHCVQGHEYATDGVYLYNGYRVCKPCKIESVKRYKQRKKAA